MAETPVYDLIGEAKDGLEEGAIVRLLIGGADWLRVTGLIEVDERLVRAELGDGTVVLFDSTHLCATSVKLR